MDEYAFVTSRPFIDVLREIQSVVHISDGHTVLTMSDGTVIDAKADGGFTERQPNGQLLIKYPGCRGVVI